MMWTAEAVEYLRANWATQSASVIGRKLRCSRNAVIGKAHRLNLPPKPSGATYGWSDADTAFLRENYTRMRGRYIAQSLGRSLKCVYNRANYLGLKSYHLSSPPQPAPERPHKLSRSRAG